MGGEIARFVVMTLILIALLLKTIAWWRYVNDGFHWGIGELLYLPWWLKYLWIFVKELYFDVKFYKYEEHVPAGEAMQRFFEDKY